MKLDGFDDDLFDLLDNISKVTKSKDTKYKPFDKNADPSKFMQYITKFNFFTLIKPHLDLIPSQSFLNT
jgi:hypothetical protein